MSARLTVDEARQAGLLPDRELVPRQKGKRRKRGPKALNKGEETMALHCRAAGVPEPQRQFLFAKALGRQFTADFGWPEFRLLLEVDGGVWRKGGGAHSHPTNIRRDMDKANAAALLGYCVARFTPEEVESGKALTFVQRYLRERGWNGLNGEAKR